jgi:23S rRNA (guanine745-N1)-methyltransferase
MSLFVCPICGESLNCDGQKYACPLGHSFDISREGYVHLLPANKKHSKAPGDDKNMVLARNRFLSGGLYEPLRAELIKIILSEADENANILDSGCGEGYYTEGIFQALADSGKTPRIAGIDISRDAVRLAAKRLKEVEFAVASAYHLPVGDESADMVLNCFSPLCREEFHRVLRRGGVFIYVVPAPRHLWELKCALYDKPYENERLMTAYEGFSLEKTKTVESRILLPDRANIADLFTMTPYFWKTPREGILRMEKLESLETEISFDIHVYRKV